jgi:ABC-type glycerol-3-phosphate transport system permease component
LVAATTTLICILLGGFCAYALARLEFPFKRVLIAGVLAIAMFPQISILSPLYLSLRKLGLIDTYPGLILPYLTFSMPLTVWLLVTHFRKLPYGIEEAALLDGAGRLRTLVEVILPSTLPGILTTAVLTFVYCYNEFLFALAFTLGPEHQTVPVAIALLRGRYQVPWGQVLAAAMVASLPVLVLVTAFQRRIVQGFSR